MIFLFKIFLFIKIYKMNDNEYNNFIDNLKDFKDYESYTNVQLTELLNITNEKINNIFSENSNLDLNLLENLSQSLETTKENKEDFAEISTPIDLLYLISENSQYAPIEVTNIEWMIWGVVSFNIHKPT